MNLIEVKNATSVFLAPSHQEWLRAMLANDVPPGVAMSVMAIFMGHMLAGISKTMDVDKDIDPKDFGIVVAAAMMDGIYGVSETMQ